MKTIRIAVLIGLTAVFSVGAAENEAPKKDLAQLQGEWTMVSGSVQGQPLPDELVKQMKRICKGDELTTTRDGETFFKAKVTIDASKTPKTIDYDMTEGTTKGKKHLGIYEVDGDTLKSCFSAPGDERPTDFTTKPGDKRTSTVWKRAKAAAPADHK
jgi:uncharacterized protein (TIGR03067 family)